MPPGFAFGLVLAMKMAVTAALVILASLAVEMMGPLIGAMVATLPISAGPAYVFLALDHGSDFIARSAQASLVINAANIAFCAVYTLMAQSCGQVLSLATAMAAWFVFALLCHTLPWSVSGAAVLNVVAFLSCLPLAGRFGSRVMPATVRRWYDAPFRAVMVVVLVATVVTLSSHVGPTVTGILALYPVVLTSLVLIFHHRVGGSATAAITANAIPGLGGYGIALLVLNRAAIPMGTAVALLFALAVSIGWNGIIVGWRRRNALVKRRSGGASVTAPE